MRARLSSIRVQGITRSVKVFATLVLLSGLPIGCSKPKPIDEIVRDPSTPFEAASPVHPSETDWPWWRGIGRDAVSRDENPPTEWSATENVAWKTGIPGRGHSSPTLWGNQVFLTTADEQKKSQSLLSLDRETGNLLWTSVVHEGGLMGMHAKNTQASATAACDGERVFATFANANAVWVTAVDLAGKIVWQTSAGKFSAEHGFGASPVIHGSLVIVSGDSPAGGFVAALHRKTGEIVWRTARPNIGTYATPIVATVAGKPQVLLQGADMVASYDPDSGKQLWRCNGPATTCGCTVAFLDNMVFASGGYPQRQLLGIRVEKDGSGASVAWESNKGVTYVPSPLAHQGRLFVIEDDGVANCIEAESGKSLWKSRLSGGFTSSPVLAGDYLFATNEAGTTYVISAGAKFEKIAENSLNEPVFASPVIAGGKLYLRTDRSLYCIGAASPKERSSPVSAR